MKRSPDDWRGYIAFVMALGISVGFGAALIMSASARTPPINETTATLLATLGGAMVGAIATYMGMGMGRNERAPTPKDDDEPEP